MSAELKLDNEKAMREKDRELKEARAAIEKKKKNEKDKKKKKRKSKEGLSSDDDSTSSDSDVRTPEDQRRRRKEKQRKERRRGREELCQTRERLDAMSKQLDLAFEQNRNLMAAGIPGFGQGFVGHSPMPTATYAGYSAGNSAGNATGGSGAASTGPKKKQQRRRPVEDEEDDVFLEEIEEEKNEEPVQQTEDDVTERFKAAAGTKRMVDIIKATKKFPVTWAKEEHNGGQTRPALIKHMVAADAELWGAKKLYSWMRSYGEISNGGGPGRAEVKAGEYVGSDLRVWLQARSTDEVMENVVDIQPGLLESTSWKVVKLLFGHNKVSATMFDEQGETRLVGKLREVVNDLKRKVVRLKLEKGVTAVWDRWACEVAKKLVRTPETTVELYRCSLEQLVRLFEAVRPDLPWKDRAKVRRHVSLAAKKVHNFTLKGVYPLKLPPADAWKNYGVRKVTAEMVKDLRVLKVVENFVRRRTMPVMTSTVKLRDFFCNFRELTMLKERPECLCHMAAPELPRVDGHVCARTTQLTTGPLAVLNKNLKDTPVTTVNFEESMEKASTDYAVQFAGAAQRVQDATVWQLLPVTLTVDARTLSLWLTVMSTRGVLQHWVELRDEEAKLIFRVHFERFNRLLLRLVVWGEVKKDCTLLELCKVVARRMLFWVSRITRDYCITPYSDQDVLRSVLNLTDEMLGTPFDMNVNAAAFFTPYPEDRVFGAGVDTSAAVFKKSP
ncbi:hypothetical protein CYMTET_11931 [Cymbomonas tetramitiformis]|uniref:Uncharacterized protein n=1 Tax=Cymbomonas tetramitiformis TaxID=36881 RepID=A0AAE0GL35_9CHLO|nr:hypothetical protein CYMTET_11931 [Cymbomonas tetramitiformis]